MVDNKEVIIIPREGKYKIYSSYDGTDHYSLIKKYLEEEKIEIEGIEDNNVTGKACELLSKNGFSTTIVEGSLMIIYLPELISKKQSEFYMSTGIKNMILRKNFHYSYFENGDTVFDTFDDERTNNNRKVKIFYKTIKDNLKEQEESVIHGHKPINK